VTALTAALRTTGLTVLVAVAVTGLAWKKIVTHMLRSWSTSSGALPVSAILVSLGMGLAARISMSVTFLHSQRELSAAVKVARVSTRMAPIYAAIAPLALIH
jgi:nitrate reductase gamma subunit